MKCVASVILRTTALLGIGLSAAYGQCVVTIVQSVQCSGPHCSGTMGVQVCGDKYENVTC